MNPQNNLGHVGCQQEFWGPQCWKNPIEGEFLVLKKHQYMRGPFSSLSVPRSPLNPCLVTGNYHQIPKAGGCHQTFPSNPSPVATAHVQILTPAAHPTKVLHMREHHTQRSWHWHNKDADAVRMANLNLFDDIIGQPSVWCFIALYHIVQKLKSITDRAYHRRYSIS